MIFTRNLTNTCKQVYNRRKLTPKNESSKVFNLQKLIVFPIKNFLGFWNKTRSLSKPSKKHTRQTHWKQFDWKVPFVASGSETIWPSLWHTISKKLLINRLKVAIIPFPVNCLARSFSWNVKCPLRASSWKIHENRTEKISRLIFVLLLLLTNAWRQINCQNWTKASMCNQIGPKQPGWIFGERVYKVCGAMDSKNINKIIAIQTSNAHVLIRKRNEQAQT
jgi:hypothetical protein